MKSGRSHKDNIEAFKVRVRELVKDFGLEIDKDYTVDDLIIIWVKK